MPNFPNWVTRIKIWNLTQISIWDRDRERKRNLVGGRHGIRASPNCVSAGRGRERKWKRLERNIELVSKMERNRLKRRNWIEGIKIEKVGYLQLQRQSPLPSLSLSSLRELAKQTLPLSLWSVYIYTGIAWGCSNRSVRNLNKQNLLPFWRFVSVWNPNKQDLLSLSLSLSH